VKALILVEVVDVAAGAGDQARVLAPPDGVTQDRAGRQSLYGKASVTCRGRSDNTLAAPERLTGSVETNLGLHREVVGRMDCAAVQQLHRLDKSESRFHR